jgi:hypothetical protein
MEVSGYRQMSMLWVTRRSRTCPSILVWTEAVAKLTKWMKTNQTHPKIAKAISSRLLHWQNDSTSEQVPGQHNEQLSSRQAILGLDEFVYGCLNLGWREVQEQYLLALESRKMGKRWVSALIRKLCQITLDMWEHRNNILHKAEKGTLNMHLANQIRKEFGLGPSGLAPAAKKLFCAGLTNILDRIIAVKQAWLRRVQGDRKRQLRQAESLGPYHTEH